MGAARAGAAAQLFDLLCVADAETSDGVVGSAAAAAAGERVRVSSQMSVPRGTVYQDILEAPGGQRYYASVVTLTVPPGDQLTVDPGSVDFRINGVSPPVTTGTEPMPGTWVINHTQTILTGHRWDVYFPGDVPAMLAEQSGTGLPSYVATSATMFELAVDGVVGADTPAMVPVDAARCDGSLSNGPANQKAATESASVAVVEPKVSIDKRVNSATAAPGALLEYTLELASPVEVNNVAPSTAYDVVVTDTLPAGLDPTDAAGSVLDDGEVSESGGTWDATARTLTFRLEPLAAGGTTVLTYHARVRTAGANLTNTASVDVSSLPGDQPGERVYTAVDTAEASVAVAGTAPTVSKFGDATSAPLGEPVRFEVDYTLPAGIDLHDVVFFDELPPGMSIVSEAPGTGPPLLSCTAGCAGLPGMNRLADYVSPSGSTTVGWSAALVSQLPQEAELSLVYWAQLDPQLPGGEDPMLGDRYTNQAAVSANLVPRMGVVVPSLSNLGTADLSSTDTFDLTFERPIIEVAKTAASRSVPFDPADGDKITWTVTVTNSGNAAATDVVLTDQVPADFAGDLQDVTTPPGVTITPGDPLSIAIESIGAGSSIEFSYSARPSASSVIDLTQPIRNTVGVTNYADAAGHAFEGDDTATSETLAAAPMLTIDKTRTSATQLAAMTSHDVTWSIVVQNTGNAMADNVIVVDRFASSNWTYVTGSVTGASAATISGGVDFRIASPIAPGASVTITYQTRVAAGAPGWFTNSATVMGTDMAGRTSFTDAFGTHSLWATDTAYFETVGPRVTVAKFPNLADNSKIIEGGVAKYTITITNPGTVRASDLVINDALPDGLIFEPAATPEVTPSALASRFSQPATASDAPVFGISYLDPGQAITFKIPVRIDDPPAAGVTQLVNTAVVTVPGGPTVSDTGVLIFQPTVLAPTATKTADPTEGSPGDSVVYPVRITFPKQSSAVYDTAVIDTLPDGIDLTSIEMATCESGPCSSLEHPTGIATSVTQADGTIRVMWYFGDAPARTEPIVLEAVIRGTVRSSYRGTTSARPAGSKVVEGAGGVLVNRVTGYGNGTNAGPYPGVQPSNPTTAWAFRSATNSADFTVRSPNVEIAKIVSDNQVEPGDTVTYRIQVANTGSRPGYRILVDDDMGSAATSNRLDNVVIGTLPAGVTVINDWTAGDPVVRFQIDQLDPGEVVELTYTATPLPSADLFPRSGDTRDVAAILNTATLIESHSTAAPSAGDVVQSGSTMSTLVHVYTPTPFVVGACLQVPTLSNDATFMLTVANQATAGGTWIYPGGVRPANPAEDGLLYDTRLTTTIPAAVEFVSATIGTTAVAITPSLVQPNPDGTTTLRFDLGDVTTASGKQVRVTVARRAPGGPLQFVIPATVSGVDGAGASSRGDNTASLYTYSHTSTVGCLGGSSAPPTFRKYLSAESGTRFTTGEVVPWSIVFSEGSGTNAKPATNPVITDVFPAELEYAPGSATFSVGGLAPGSTPQITETITPLSGGRTQVQWSGWGVISNLNVQVRPIVVKETEGFVFSTNTAQLTANESLGNGCAVPGSLCDSAAAEIEVRRDPIITKSTDGLAVAIGDRATHTVRLTIPAGFAYTDGLILDDPNRNMTATPAAEYQILSAVCVDCAVGEEIVPVALPIVSGDLGQVMGWSLGDISAAATARTIEIRYSLRLGDHGQAMELIPSWNERGDQTYLDHVGFYSSPVTDSPTPNGFEVGPDSTNWYAELRDATTAELMAARVGASAADEVRYAHPEIAKSCTTNGKNGMILPVDSGPNVECTITVHNPSSIPMSAIEVDDLMDRYVTGAIEPRGAAVSWELLSIDGPVTERYPWDGFRGGWVFDGQLEAGKSLSAVLRYRAHPWPEFAKDSFAIDFTPSDSVQYQNNASVGRYTLDVDSPVSIENTGQVEQARGNWLFAVPVGATVQKHRIVPRFADPELGSYEWFERDAILPADNHRSDECSVPWDLGPDATRVEFCGNTRQSEVTDGAHPWALKAIIVGGVESLSSFQLADFLPPGFRYKPGSARLLVADGRVDGIMTYRRIALDDPEVTPGSGVCVSDQDVYGLEPIQDGDQLAWSFDRAASGGAGLPWAGANSFLSTVTEVPGPMEWPVDSFVIEYDTDAAAAQACVTERGDFAELTGGDVTLNAQFRGGTVSTSRARSLDRLISEPTMTKTPDAGAVLDGDTTEFEIEVGWESGSGAPAQNALVVTDTMRDANPLAPDGFMYTPETATITATNEAGDTMEVPFTESLDRSSGQTVATWTIEQIDNSVGFSESLCGDRPEDCYGKITVRIRIPLTVPEGTPDRTVISNVADVVLSHGDPLTPYLFHSDEMSDAGQITVVRPADPPVPSKSGPAVAAIGDRATWDITVVLPAASIWFDLAYHDVLPAGVTFDGYRATGCIDALGRPCAADLDVTTIPAVTNSDGTTSVGWLIDDVDAASVNRIVTLRVSGRVADVAANVTGHVLRNTVYGTSNDRDTVAAGATTLPSTWDNAPSAVAAANTTIAQPVVAVEKLAVEPGPFTAGQLTHWRVRIHNTGTVPAYNMVFTDTPNAALRDILSDSQVSTGPNLAFPIKGWTAADPRWRWSIPVLAAGERIELTYTAVVASDYAAAGLTEVSNVATVSDPSSQPRGASGGRSYPGATDSVTMPLAGPDLVVEKFADSGCNASSGGFTPGAAVNWCVTVKNQGTTVAENVSAVDLLPSGWTHVSGSGEPAVSSATPITGGTTLLRWELGDIAVGETVTITYQTVAAMGGASQVENVAAAAVNLVEGATPRDLFSGYFAMDRVRSNANAPVLDISKLPDNQLLGLLPAGGPIGWDIVVTNSGAVDQTNISVTDLLPAGLDYAAGSASCAGACVGFVHGPAAAKGSGPDGTTPINWSLSSLAVDAAATIHVTATIDAAGRTPTLRDYLNHAEARSDQVGVVANQAKATVYAPGSIGDHVWNDADKDGIQDDGESGVAGVTVVLTGTDIAGRPVSLTVETDSSGNYRFDGLVPGTYTVRFARPSGWRESLAGAGQDESADSNGPESSITLESGQDRLDVDYGLYRLTSPPPTTVPPTTEPPTTVPPTTEPPTTEPPTTVPPTTDAPTTVPPTTVPPSTVTTAAVPPTTGTPTTTVPPSQIPERLSETGGSLRLAWVGLAAISAGLAFVLLTHLNKRRRQR